MSINAIARGVETKSAIRSMERASSIADPGLSRRTFLITGGTAAAMALTRLASRSAAAQPIEEIYSGIALTRIEYQDAAGLIQGVRDYQVPVRVIFSTPKSAGGVTETNPFSLTVAPDDPGVEGAVEIWSSFPAVDPVDGREVLFQYWDLQLNADGLIGELTNSHTAEAVALNLINTAVDIAPGITLPTPSAIIEGTTLQGVLQDDELTLRIEGNTVSLNRPFVCEVTATRQ